MSTSAPGERAAGEAGTIVDAVVAAIADELGADPMELDPLHESVDPDALESIFRDTSSATRDGGTVTFESNGCAVTVGADGTVTVRSFSAGE